MSMQISVMDLANNPKIQDLTIPTIYLILLDLILLNLIQFH